MGLFLLSNSGFSQTANSTKLGPYTQRAGPIFSHPKPCPTKDFDSGFPSRFDFG